MKKFNAVRKYGFGVAIGALASAPAFAEGIDDIWGAIDLSGTSVKVIAAGVIIIGIAMALKSISLGKRTVNKI